MLYHLAMYVPLLGLLVGAAMVDLRSRRIPNWLTFSLVLSGLACSFVPGGVTPWQSLAGVPAGMALPFVLFAIGALGAGDVKLLAGVGAWLGPWGALLVFAAAAVVAAVLVVVQCLAQGRLGVLLRNSLVVMINLVHIRQLGVQHVTETGQEARSVDRPLPYAVPVLIATLLLMLLSPAGRWPQ